MLKREYLIFKCNSFLINSNRNRSDMDNDCQITNVTQNPESLDCLDAKQEDHVNLKL